MRREFESLADQKSRWKGSIEPGDQVLIKIPHMPGDTGRVWGICLDKKSEGKTYWVVVDEIFVLSRTPGFAPNSIVKIRHEQIVARIPRDPVDGILSISMRDGVIEDLRRVDGKTAPVTVRIDDGDGSVTHTVDHRGHRPVEF